MPRYVKEFSINESNGRMSLQLSPTGDIQLIEKEQKLVAQILRAVINEQTKINSALNNPRFSSMSSEMSTLMNIILRAFKSNQVNDTRRADNGLLGFYVYKKLSGSNNNFVKITTNPVTYKYVDTNVTNGTAYDYQLTKVYDSGYESFPVDTFTLTPSKFNDNFTKLPQIGGSSVGIPENKQNQVYVDFNRTYRSSELLDEILALDILQDQEDPRKVVINIVLRNLRGNRVSVASVKAG